MNTADLHIVYCKLTGLHESDFKVVFDKLNLEEQLKCKSYFRSSDRLAFLVGRSLLTKYVLKSSFQLRDISYLEFGKPFIPAAPHFNISHSANYVVLAFSSQNEIGVDVEEMNEIAHDELSRFFTEKEQLLINESANPKEVFYRVWTAKEAFIKCLGKGLQQPLNSFCVADTLQLTLDKKVYTVRHVNHLLAENYMLSVCSPGIDYVLHIAENKFSTI